MVNNNELISNKDIYLQLNRAKNYLFRNDLFVGFVNSILYLIPVILLLFFIDIAFELNQTLRVIVLIFITLYFLYILYKNLIHYILKYFNFFKGYDNYSIALRLIADSEIQDKVLIYLELKEYDQANILINQALEQKRLELKDLNFTSRLNIKIPSKLFIVISLFLLAFFVTSLLIETPLKKAALRVFYPAYQISYKTLDYILLSDSLNIIQNQDIEVKVKIKGTYIPDQIFLRIGDKDIFAKNINDSIWSYKFVKLNQSLQFYFHDNLNQSEIYRINVNPLPVLKNLSVEVFPPSHTNIESFSLSGLGNFSFPEGSKIKWFIEALNSQDLIFKIDDKELDFKKSEKGFIVEIVERNSFDYSFKLFSGYVWNEESYEFSTNCIKDEFPKIDLQVTETGNIVDPVILSGSIGDDYGFTNFEIVHKYNDTVFIIPLQYNKQNLNQTFYYQHNIYELYSHLNTDKIEYYLRVTDNDAVNNFKSTNSQYFTFDVPDSKELENRIDNISTDLTDKLALGLEMLRELNIRQKDIEAKFKNEKLNKWEQSQLTQQLEQNKSDINKLLNEINALNQQIKSLSKINSSENKLYEKQSQINELLEKLMDNELSELFKELERLKSELKDKQISKSTNKLSTEELEELMNRNLEILKRFEIEKGLSKVVDDLKMQAQNLDTVSDKSSRENIEKDVKETLDKHSELLDKNKKLDDPYNLEDFEKEKQEIIQNLESNDNSENQRNQNKRNSQRISQLAEMIGSNLSDNLQEQNVEDLSNLKQIRSNLLQLSFIQEFLVENFKNARTNSPAFNTYRVKQKEIISSWEYIKDSINTLIIRNPMLGNIMADDLSGVENFNNIILSSIFKENPTNPTVQEYKVLSHYNTLLLFIDEAIQRSESDMNSSGQQGGSCPKPGQGKPSPGNTKNALQGLKQQLKDLMNKMKQAGEGSNPSESLSEQLGSILSQQEQMQKMINEIMNQGQFGQAAKQLMREVNQLIDQNIDNILNKSISTETIARQERIITRLLESEKAEQERDKDEKRQSIENLHEFITTPKEIDIDDMKEDSFNESLYFRLLNLNKYYLDLYQKYLNAAN